MIHPKDSALIATGFFTGTFMILATTHIYPHPGNTLHALIFSALMIITFTTLTITFSPKKIKIKQERGKDEN